MANDTEQITVKVPSSSPENYPIIIGSAILETIFAQVEKNWPGKKFFVVTDENLRNAGHLDKLLAGKKVDHYSIDPPGEISKHIKTVVKIIEKMEKAYFGRDAMIIALGGGTVGDIAGFAAAIYKRGIPVVQIPTTTVAQADSSVGGKTGVDSTISKNAFGTFHQPAAVYIDVETLKTLEEKQYLAGLVESVKHALICDAAYFDYIETNIEKMLEKDTETLKQIALYNCKIKASVVEKDPKEQNLRRILNYGHTIGHAVESASSFELLHGQAVAIGIIAAVKIAQEMKVAKNPPELLKRITNLLDKLKMPTKIPANIKHDELIELLKRDKKAIAQWPRFVLIEEIGKTLCKDQQWAHEVPKEIVEKTIDKMY